MKALILQDAGKFRIETIDVPQPADDEVLARVKAVAICGRPEDCKGLSLRAVA